MYNDETAAENFSVRFIDLFDAADSFSVNEGVAQDFFELNDESDFVCLVRKIIFDAPLEIYLVPREEVYTPFQSQPENLAFLKKIWGYDSAGKSLIFQFPALWLAEKFQLFTIVISPLIRQQIVQKISADEVNILYISPETLLARSDVEQLIGARTLGLIVAHIVTTWGKQFRPYLGDHIRRLQKNQRERRGHAFVIATFTATMIFQGFENMYEETVDPIRYFGELKRGDIEIEIDRSPIQGGQGVLHDILKFDDLQRAVRSGKKFVMLATKAFGMGNDIEIVLHYAPTGNVCDYVQEIGRAARKNNLHGVARYHYSKNDFKYINHLHGLSTIKLYQIFEVIKKLCEIYRQNRAKNICLVNLKQIWQRACQNLSQRQCKIYRCGKRGGGVRRSAENCGLRGAESQRNSYCFRRDLRDRFFDRLQGAFR